jgi:hypothetical protein
VTDPKSYDLDEIRPAVEDELYSRLEAELSAKDREAIKTALAKMGARSFSRGMAVQAQATNEVLAKLAAEHPDYTLSSVDPEFPDFGKEIDFWAEQYGDQS